jgi:hypothetical protein
MCISSECNDIRRIRIILNMMCHLKSLIDQNSIIIISNSMVILKDTSYL